MVPLLSRSNHNAPVITLGSSFVDRIHHGGHIITNRRPVALRSKEESNFDETLPLAKRERGHAIKDSLSIAVGPAAILGVTSMVYSAAAKSSLLSPVAATCMLLLALQYSLQPRVSKKFIPQQANKQNVALVEEIVKTIMALGLLFATTSGETLVQLRQDWSLSSSLLVAGIPASLYAVQGVLTYTAYQSLDPMTFNGLMQTKTLSAALFCFLLLGRGQSWVQMAALAILTVSALLFQGSESRRNSIATTTTTTNTAQPPQPTPRFGTIQRLGVVACLVATAISGLAGSLSQKGLQMTGSSGRNAYLYTVEVSFYSAVCLCLSIWSNHKSSSSRSAAGRSSSSRFFESWTPCTLVPIVLKAFGGLLTAFVHKHAGSVTKGFALILGLVLTGVIQAVLDKKTLSRDEMLGTGLVLLSSWLHFTNPPK